MSLAALRADRVPLWLRVSCRQQWARIPAARFEPACLSGTAGFKPTYGLVSRAGVIANSYTFDHCGPLTWTVEDSALMMQALAGHDTRDPASANVDIPDFAAVLGGDLKGKRIGIVRHFYEEDLPANDETKQALEAAYDVLRNLGAELEDIRLRTCREYMDVKVTIAESELYNVHEGNLRTRPSDFGSDFLGRSTPACLITGADYVAAQRERRVMLAEMAPIYERYDLLVTAGTYAAPRFDAHRTISFWEKPAITTPFNVTGGRHSRFASATTLPAYRFRCRSSENHSMTLPFCKQVMLMNARHPGGRSDLSLTRMERFSPHPNRHRMNHQMRMPRRDSAWPTPFPPRGCRLTRRSSIK